jgi:hypothetical protein
MDDSTAPILIESGDKLYRVMNVSVGNDGSYYFTFPKAGGYYLKQYTSTQYLNAKCSSRRIKLHEVGSVYHYPKVSFHPMEQTIHIKDNSGEIIDSKEYKLCNFANNENEFLCPVMQVILPKDLSFLEEFKKTKYKHCCYIKDSRKTDNKLISLFFYIHTMDTEPDIKYISQGNAKYALRATMKTYAPFTFSVFSGEIDNRAEVANLILCINTKDGFLTLTLA